MHKVCECMHNIIHVYAFCMSRGRVVRVQYVHVYTAVGRREGGMGGREGGREIKGGMEGMKG